MIVDGVIITWDKLGGIQYPASEWMLLARVNKWRWRRRQGQMMKTMKKRLFGKIPGAELRGWMCCSDTPQGLINGCLGEKARGLGCGIRV